MTAESSITRAQSHFLTYVLPLCVPGAVKCAVSITESNLHIDLENVDEFHDFDPELDGTLLILPPIGSDFQAVLPVSSCSFSDSMSTAASILQPHSSKSAEDNMHCILVRKADDSVSDCHFRNSWRERVPHQMKTSSTYDLISLYYVLQVSDRRLLDWNLAEVDSFVACLFRFGKNFSKIGKSMQFPKPVSDVIAFYYQWKKQNAVDYKNWKGAERKKPIPANIANMTIIEFYGDVCEECGSGGQLICCDTCCRCYHKYCVNPPFADEPLACWSCPACTTRIYDITERRKAVVCVQQHVRALDVFNSVWRRQDNSLIKECLTLCMAAANSHSFSLPYTDCNMEALVKNRLELKLVNRRLQRMLRLGLSVTCDKAGQFHQDDLARLWQHQGDTKVTSTSRAHQSLMLNYSVGSGRQSAGQDFPRLKYVRCGSVFSMRGVVDYDSQRSDVKRGTGDEYFEDDDDAVSEDDQEDNEGISDDDFGEQSRSMGNVLRLTRPERLETLADISPQQQSKYENRVAFIASRANPREKSLWNIWENLALCIGAKNHNLDWRSVFLDDDLFSVMNTRNIHSMRGRWRTFLKGLGRKFENKTSINLSELVDDQIADLSQYQCHQHILSAFQASLAPFISIQGETYDASYQFITSALSTNLNFDEMFNDGELTNLVRPTSVADIRHHYEEIKGNHEMFCHLVWRAHLKLGNGSNFPILTNQLLSPIDILFVSKKFEEIAHGDPSRLHERDKILSPATLKLESCFIALENTILSNEELDSVINDALSVLRTASNAIEGNWKDCAEYLVLARWYFGYCASDATHHGDSMNPLSTKIMNHARVKKISKNQIVDYLTYLNYSCDQLLDLNVMKDFWVLYHAIDALNYESSDDKDEKGSSFGFNAGNSSVSTGTFGGKKPVYIKDTFQMEEVTDEILIEEEEEKEPPKNPRSSAFSADETAALLEAVKRHGAGHWNAISGDEEFKDRLKKRNASSLKSRYKYLVNQDMLDDNLTLQARPDHRKSNDDDSAIKYPQKRKRGGSKGQSDSLLTANHLLLFRKNNDLGDDSNIEFNARASRTVRLPVSSSESKSAPAQAALSSSVVAYQRTKNQLQACVTFHNTLKALDAECKMIEVECSMLRSINQKVSGSRLKSPQELSSSELHPVVEPDQKFVSKRSSNSSNKVVNIFANVPQVPLDNRTKLDADSQLRMIEYQTIALDKGKQVLTHSSAVDQQQIADDAPTDQNKKKKQRKSTINVPQMSMSTRKKVLPKLEEYDFD